MVAPWSRGVILGFILALIVIALFTTLVGRYRRCPSNKILVIYGKTGVPIELDNALSRENIRVSVPTTVTAAISTEPGLMKNAAIRLLGLTQEEIQNQAQDIILGQMRAVIATMEIEQINRDRQAFMGKVNEAVSSELEKIGLGLINVNIRDIEDESGYIEALGKRAAAEAINQALVDVMSQSRSESGRPAWPSVGATGDGLSLPQKRQPLSAKRRPSATDVGRPRSLICRQLRPRPRPTQTRRPMWPA